MGIELLPDFIRENYTVLEWKHACAVLKGDFPEEFQNVIDVFTEFRFLRSWISVGGGPKSKVSDAIDTALAERGWREKAFETKIVVDDSVLESPTHKVDCFKNKVALEIEWNNKDPFFDRDLNNFRLLFDLRAISVGIIVTRCDELQEIFVELGRGKSYGASTTHLGKLLPRIEGGGGGGCPILVLGISKTLYLED
ncbi:MAG: BglII/BstYI family type II restriction endonuclease [Candidatus Zixiibacteriota bacterium]